MLRSPLCYDEVQLNQEPLSLPRLTALPHEHRQQSHIEPNGAKQVKAAAPEAILVFIMPPSMEELEKRLRGRGDTPEEQIAMRMERATWEMEQRSWYDYVVVNDSAERCANEILKIIAE